MLTKALPIAIFVLALSGLFSTEAIAKGTPDGLPPANENVCDDVFFSTPGLYGLCVAFCEAQDCEATLDPDSGEVTFEANCKASNNKILDNYNRRKTSSDPEMPCVNVVENECPCWTEAELDAIADGTTFTCGAAGSDFAQLIGSDLSTGGIDRVAANSGARDCFYQEQSPSTTIRFFNVSEDEADICQETLLLECADRGY